MSVTLMLIIIGAVLFWLVTREIKRRKRKTVI